MLTLREVSAGYGRITILRDVDLALEPGRAVGLFGRNGAGKTTLAKTVVSVIRPTSGEILWHGEKLNRLRTEQVVKRGISLVPQSRGLFMGLTVHENLVLACSAFRLGRHEIGERADEIYERFPSLKSRRGVAAASLSGGEQQMLAIGKALMRRPKLLILDEPSTGLAPKVLEDIAALVQELRNGELSLLLTEQNIHWAFSMVDSAYVIDQGRIVDRIDSSEHRDDDVDRLLARYLGATEAIAGVGAP